MRSIFLCHSHEDKEFVRNLDNFLIRNGIKTWFDEAEIKIGDSLIDKIAEGIKKADYVAIILSPSSMESNWVKKELEMAITQEIEDGKKKVLPILIENCEIPEYLKTKKWGDFRTSSSSISGMSELLKVLEKNLLIKKSSFVGKDLDDGQDIKRFRAIFNKANTVDFAGGMGLSKMKSVELAKFFSKKQNHSKFDKFKKVFDEANTVDFAGGMGLSKDQSLDLAFKMIGEESR